MSRATKAADADIDVARAPDGTIDAPLAGSSADLDADLRFGLFPDPTASDDASSFTPACACGAGFQQKGMATWYGKRFHGRRTASGERYDMHALTAAHRSLPLGACVRVTALGSTRSVIVRINDRGPFVAGRIIDLSYAAAQALGFGSSGNVQVALERVRGAGRCQEAGA